MNTFDGSKIDHLKRVLDTSIEFLQTVRETSWVERLKVLRAAIEADPVAGAGNVLRAFEGEESFERLYLSGPRNGHNLSERQEIEANGKLHVIQTEMRKAAGELARMAS